MKEMIIESNELDRLAKVGNNDFGDAVDPYTTPVIATITLTIQVCLPASVTASVLAGCL